MKLTADRRLVFLSDLYPSLCPTEVELEEAWLTKAGLSSLVTGSLSEEGSPLTAEVLLSTLTRQQATTVRRRLDNYNETLKTRNRQPNRDVRDIFAEVGNTHTHTHAHTHTHRYGITTKLSSFASKEIIM